MEVKRLEEHFLAETEMTLVHAYRIAICETVEEAARRATDGTCVVQAAGACLHASCAGAGLAAIRILDMLKDKP